MANHKSALKKYIRDEKRRLVNRVNRSKMKNKVKSLLKSLSTGNLEEAKKIYPEVIARIDKTVTKGTIHKKTASRYKSRLTLRMKKAGADV